MADKKRQITLFLIILNLAVFWPLLTSGFVALDDDEYVVKNKYVLSGLSIENVKWAFTTNHNSVWQPITWISYMVDSQIFGTHPTGYHLTNLLLHICSTLLLFFTLAKMTHHLYRSLFVALLFSIHPLRLESVAWVAERKDVLGVFFWMLTLWLYYAYTCKPDWKKYLAVIISFSLGLMSKPLLITLPIALLLLDYWPICRKNTLRNLIIEKVPLLVLSAVVTLVTYHIQRTTGALSMMEVLPWNVRFNNAALSYVIYLRKLFWPGDLAILYPHFGNPPLWKTSLAICLLAMVSLTAIYYARKKPFLFVGWFWYLITMMPMSGIIQTGGHAMADRFTYIPLIGIYIIIIWLASEIKLHKKYILIPAVLSILALSITTRIQALYWQDAVTIFSRALQVTHDNARVHNLLGNVFTDAGQFQEGLQHLYEAVRITPNSPDAQNDLGAALVLQHKHDEAKEHLLEAIKLSPNYKEAYYNIGILLMQQGKMDEAIEYYQKAIERNKQYAAAYYNIATVYYSKRDYKQAWNYLHLSEKYGLPVPDAAREKLIEKMPEPKE